MERGQDAREIVVIGAGLGGLSAAALLAKAGHRVRVLERAREPGGHARSQQQDGYTFNLGAHALYRNGPAMQLLAQLGIIPSGRRVTGAGVFVTRAEELHALPYDATSMWKSRLLDARGKLQLGRALLGLGEGNARRMRARNVRQWLDTATPAPDVRMLLQTLVRLSCYAHAPELIAADRAMQQLARAMIHGVMYVDGGWQSLADALLQVARASGVVLELDSGAERIEHGNGAVQAVIARDGRRLAADAVVAAVPPKALAALLPGDAHAQRWADAAVPLRAACLDVGVRGLPHPERIAGLSLDAPLYCANHSAYARLAPAGASALQLVRYLAPGEDGQGAEPELRAFLERIQPGAYARADVKRFLPNLVVHNDVPGAERARAQHPELRGLHLVGDSASDRAMLTDAVLDSARTAADRICAKPALGRAAAAKPRWLRPAATRAMVGAERAGHTGPSR